MVQGYRGAFLVLQHEYQQKFGRSSWIYRYTEQQRKRRFYLIRPGADFEYDFVWYVWDISFTNSWGNCPKGYDQLDTNLNEGVYFAPAPIWLCVKRSILSKTARPKPILEMKVASWTHGLFESHYTQLRLNVPDGMTRVFQNLNSGNFNRIVSVLDFKKSWQDVAMVDEYLHDIKVVAHDANESPAVPKGYNLIHINLNQSAGGMYIYLMYKMESIPDHLKPYFRPSL